MSHKTINCLYRHFKDTPKKLKIICDWDEVIQTHESYTTWLAIYQERSEESKLRGFSFPEYFKSFWISNSPFVEYSPYGSSINKELTFTDSYKEIVEKQQEIKNYPDLYQKQPFLTLAKELLVLIKADKVEELIFLSAYDQGKFPQGDPRKKIIFQETFGKYPFCSLQLIGFDNEKKGANKADWIKANANDFDLVIDDNPAICWSISEQVDNKTVLAPFYPAIESRHHPEVILIKTSVSDLKKEDF